MKIRIEWPFVSRGRFDELKAENWELRGALRRNNEELRKYRLLVGKLREGDPEVTAVIERMKR